MTEGCELDILAYLMTFLIIRARSRNINDHTASRFMFKFDGKQTEVSNVDHRFSEVAEGQHLVQR